MERTNCNIVSYEISDLQVSRLTPAAAVITHKTTVDGSCGGDRLPNASWTATAYVLEVARWKAVFRAGSAIVDPAKLARQTVEKPAAGRPVSNDANTQAMLDREQAILMRGRPGTQNDSIRWCRRRSSSSISSGRTSVPGPRPVVPGPGKAATLRASSLPMPRATMFTPDFWILTLFATVDGAVMVNPSSRSGHHRSTFGEPTPGFGASASTIRHTPVRSDSKKVIGGWLDLVKRAPAVPILTVGRRVIANAHFHE